MPTTGVVLPLSASRIMSNQLNTPTNRLYWVDYAKGIAIILVVYRHILIGIERSGIEVSVWLRNANEMVYSFRMPLFFILSGIFISRTIEKYQGSAFLKLKSKTILYPYLVWGVIQITIQIVLSNYTNSQRSFIDYTYLITNPRAIDQLWYLLALFNSSILFFILYSVLKTNQWVLLITSFVLYSGSYLIENLSLFHDLFYYFFFLVLGHIGRMAFLDDTYRVYFKSTKVLFLTLPFFFVSQWYWLNHQNMNHILFIPITLIGCFVIYSISFILADRNWLQFITIAGRHSLQIYLMHLLIVSMVRMLMVKFLHINTAWPILLACWVLGIVIPIIAYNILKKTPANILFEPSLRSTKS